MKLNLIPVLALWVCAAPALAAPKITAPILTSVDNFRDIAGEATIHGGSGEADVAGAGALRPNVVYRANALTLSPTDAAKIAPLGITEDIDLRTPAEIKLQPDVVPPGARYVNVNIYGTTVLPDFSLTTAEKANAQGAKFYRNFALDPVERHGFRAALLDIAAVKGPVVFHCTAGKDRSGWLAALLQSIAGVPQPIIMQDYLATNLYTAPRIKATLAKLPSGKRAAYAELLSGKPEFLAAGFDAVKQSYGNMDNYYARGLNLSPDQLAALRAKLVEKDRP